MVKPNGALSKAHGPLENQFWAELSVTESLGLSARPLGQSPSPILLCSADVLSLLARIRWSELKPKRKDTFLRCFEYLVTQDLFEGSNSLVV